MTELEAVVECEKTAFFDACGAWPTRIYLGRSQMLQLWTALYRGTYYAVALPDGLRLCDLIVEPVDVDSHFAVVLCHHDPPGNFVRF